MGATDRGEGLTLREAAAAVGLSMGTLRGHIREGRLAAEQVTGKYGPEYRIRPAVLAAFAAERLGKTLDAATLRRPRTGVDGAPMAADARELYERLLSATEEATRYKALAAASDEARELAATDYAAAVAELAATRQRAEAALADAAAAQAQAEAERERAERTEAELERLRARGFWARLFGGAG
jgi:hypothetical protein